MVIVRASAHAGAAERDLLLRAARVVDALEEELEVDSDLVRGWLPILVCHLIAANVAASSVVCGHTAEDSAAALEVMVREVRGGWDHGIEVGMAMDVTGTMQ